MPAEEGDSAPRSARSVAEEAGLAATWWFKEWRSTSRVQSTQMGEVEELALAPRFRDCQAKTASSRKRWEPPVGRLRAVVAVEAVEAGVPGFPARERPRPVPERPQAEVAEVLGSFSSTYRWATHPRSLQSAYHRLWNRSRQSGSGSRGRSAQRRHTGDSRDARSRVVVRCRMEAEERRPNLRDVRCRNLYRSRAGSARSSPTTRARSLATDCDQHVHALGAHRRARRRSPSVIDERWARPVFDAQRGYFQRDERNVAEADRCDAETSRARDSSCHVCTPEAPERALRPEPLRAAASVGVPATWL